jgi:hypothetical protein
MPRYKVPTPGRKGYKKRGYSSIRKKSYKNRAEYKKRTQRPGFSKRTDYPQLKHDVLLASSVPAMGVVQQQNATIKLPATGMRFTIWTPSHRVANISGGERHRHQTNCLFVGFKENLLFIGEGNVIHRRVVFWSRVAIDQAMPLSGPNESLLRNIVLRDPDSDTTLDPLLGGTRGQDYLADTIFHRKFDSNAVDVVYDRNRTHAQQGTILDTNKFWHRCEREISYQDKENGMNMDANGWAGLSSGSGGNLYVVDMYVCRGANNATVNVSFSSDVYWRERNK